MLIDKNFPGLIDGYRYNGDIITDEDIEIRIDLFVNGSISSGGSIDSENSIVVKGNISSCDSINALGSIKAYGYIHSKGNIHSWGSIYSGAWISAFVSIQSKGNIYSKCHINSGGPITALGSISAKRDIIFSQTISAKSIKMRGIKTKSLVILDGLQYRVWIFDNHIKIGCQIKSKEDWLKVTEEDAIEMGGVEMWEYRDGILNLCKNGRISWIKKY